MDVSVRVDDGLIAVELLVLQAEKERSNIEKVVRSGSYKELVLVVTTQGDLTRLKRIASEFGGEGDTEVNFQLLSDFLSGV